MRTSRKSVFDMKKIGQTIAALVYSILCTGLIYIITVFSATLILSLPTWAIILVLLLCLGALEVVLQFIHMTLLFPYHWIVKKNKVALCLSILTFVLCMGKNIYMLWTQTEGESYTMVILMSIIITIYLLRFLVSSVVLIGTMYDNTEE